MYWNIQAIWYLPITLHAVSVFVTSSPQTRLLVAHKSRFPHSENRKQNGWVMGSVLRGVKEPFASSLYHVSFPFYF